MAFFLKPNVKINFFQNLAAFWKIKKRQFIFTIGYRVNPTKIDQNRFSSAGK
jgi:hypothetical protein